MFNSTCTCNESRIINNYDFTDCPIGYHSINCSEICSFPSFGDDCQSICKCDIGLCDFRFGCTKYNGMVFFDADEFANNYCIKGRKLFYF